MTIAVANLAILLIGIGELENSDPAQSLKGLSLLFSEDFESGAAKWQPTDAKAWKISEGNGGKVFNQYRKSSYRPPHRSPRNIALLKGLSVGDFILEADVRSTIPDYGHRDMCLFFGHQDAAHFYYVHLGKKTDDHANQIFIVNGADRIKISLKTTPGTNWDDQWHKVRLVRRVKEGRIEVYFDDMERPAMTAEDKTFLTGRLGIGSFDDTGMWDNVRIYGVRSGSE